MTFVGGRYELLGEVGRGGMATVHLARQTDLDRLVALKELSALPTGDSAAAARFLREARFAGSLSHPSVVTVHDFFEEGGTPFIAMEYLPGGPLRRYQSSLSDEQVSGVLLDVLAGLAHAARLGIVHRDLKPENLLVTAEGRVKIADFGIAKAVDRARGATRLTVTGTTIGTPDYIAPEQAMGQPTGPRSDLYSLGCIAFELLVGGPPFADADSSMAILLAHVNDSVPPVSSVDPAVDPRIADWVGRMTAKEPDDRPASAEDAAAELEETALEMLGPRWRRSAALVPQLDELDPIAAPVTTRPLFDRPLATTLPPTPVPVRPTGPTAPLAPRRRGGSGRNARRGARAVLWGLALLVAAATVFARAAGGGESSRVDASPAASRSARDARAPRTTTTPAAARTKAAAATDPAAAPSPTRTPTATQAQTAAPSSSQAPPTSTPTPAPTRSCAGDSTSDDPSDDACGGEP
jgi:serine/threonine protein kinase